MHATYALVARGCIHEIRAANSDVEALAAASAFCFGSALGPSAATFSSVKFLRRALFISLISVVLVRPLPAAESLDETINYLLNYIANSKAMFIRNGTSHTPAEAVDHIKAKYEHFKNQIKTPEDFIRLAASKSLMTGKAYIVRTPDGAEMLLDAWLAQALEAHRAATRSK
jgi:hypothetical protein